MKYQDFIRTLDKFEIAVQRTEPLYFDAIGKLERVRDDLTQLDVNQHMLGVVKPYLIKWGGMGRVVGRDGLDWNRYTSTLSALEGRFGELRKKRFITLDLEEEKVVHAITTIYDELRLFEYLGGATAISKITHLLNPEVFVMWDGEIRKRYHKKNRIVDDWGRGYLEFLRMTQHEITEALLERVEENVKDLHQIEKEVRSKYKNKTLARLIDEYNYATTYPPEKW